METGSEMISLIGTLAVVAIFVILLMLAGIGCIIWLIRAINRIMFKD